MKRVTTISLKQKWLLELGLMILLEKTQQAYWYKF